MKKHSVSGLLEFMYCCLKENRELVNKQYHREESLQDKEKKMSAKNIESGGMWGRKGGLSKV